MDPVLQKKKISDLNGNQIDTTADLDTDEPAPAVTSSYILVGLEVLSKMHIQMVFESFLAISSI